MRDTFTAYSPGGSTTVNGFEVPGYTSQGTTTGKVAGSSMQARDTATRTVTVGGVELLVVEGGLHIPISATVPVAGEYGTGWEYLLSTLGEDTPASLLNSRWLVVGGTTPKSHQTALRLDVARIV
jgi:hypothetical protein